MSLGRQTLQAGSEAGRQADSEAGRHTGKQVVRQADIQASR